MIQLKNSHEKLTQSVQLMLIDTVFSLPYYGNFNLMIAFHETLTMPTAGVNMTISGMNFYYNPKFIDRLSQKEVNFLTLHEDFHLLWDHPRRTISGQYEHKLANITQDMIINHIIWQDINHNFVEIPKDEEGKNMALFVPSEYKGKLVFEILYTWLRNKRDEHKKKKEEQGNGEQGNGEQGNGEQDGSGNGNGESSKYGPYGKDPSNGGKIDTYSLDEIFDTMDSNDGQYLDTHISDEIPEEMREGLINSAMERLAARGFSPGKVEETLGKLRKKKKDHLRYIKRCISNQIFGNKKEKTISRPNRRGFFGIKGVRKVKNRINIILDVSGSMNGLIERVLNYVFKNDVEVTLIEADTQVNFTKHLKSTKGLDKVPIKGMGGTVLQPAVDYVEENLNSYSTLILTDGYCDSLDLSRLKKHVLIVSAAVEVPIRASNGKMKQINVSGSAE
jgi:predicted metal-dependent peptidase